MPDYDNVLFKESVIVPSLYKYVTLNQLTYYWYYSFIFVSIVRYCLFLVCLSRLIKQYLLYHPKTSLGMGPPLQII